HFHPATAKAAVEVLEDAGFHVTIPPVRLCCGRPLYDYGMLGLAKTMLREILSALRPQIRAGVCLVGLEPSCVSVFRDELVGLLPGDEDAKRLKQQTFLFTEFLAKKAPDYKPPKLVRKAVVHEHCHHKSVLDKATEKQLLDTLGLDYELLDSGCCGMAGAFGFEKRHYDISMKIGERVLLPKVRDAAKDTLIIADGFSCREQIAQTTDRQALHIAQVMQMALHDGPEGPGGEYPEKRSLKQTNHKQSRSALTAPALVGVGLLAGGLLVWGLRRQRSGES
ncbi:MAG: (Fe-S)-binding protein, partial [Candidatus Binatia bacterium]